MADNGVPTDAPPNMISRLLQWLPALRTIITAVLAFLSGGAISALTTAETDVLNRFPGLHYNRYETVGNDYGLSVQVPSEWDVAKAQELTLGPEVVGPAVLASQTDTVKWWTSYGVSGLYLAASRKESVLESEFDVVVDQATNASEACETGIITRTQEEKKYIVTYRVWDKCGGTDSKLLAFVARPASERYMILGLMTISHEGDWEARKRIFSSIDVDERKLSRWEPLPVS